MAKSVFQAGREKKARRKAFVAEAKEEKKSSASTDPLPPLVLYTASLKVTAMVLLSNARNTEEIIGTAWSFKVAVLLLWVVLASLPTPS